MAFRIRSSRRPSRVLAGAAAALVAAMGLGLGSPAQAADGKTFPGTFCAGSGWGDVYKYSSSSTGVYNNAWTVCPVVRDSMGRGVRYAWVRLLGEGLCYFTRTNPGSTSGFMSPGRYHNDWGRVGYLYWNGYNQLWASHVLDATYEVRCNPHGGAHRILSYKVDEN